MAQPKCGNTQCGQPLNSGDVFCGSCGTLVPHPQRTMSRPGLADQYGGMPNGAGVPLFWHEPPRQPGPLNNATRYLCAAAYLDDDFASRVIRELVATRRAVAPSLNTDVGPVIWHCQQARRNLLARNIALAGIVLLGFVLDAQATIVFLLYTILLGWLLPRARWKQRGTADKILYMLGVVAFGGLCAAALLFLTVGTFINSFASVFGTGGSLASSAQSAVGSQFKIAGTLILLLVLTWGTEFAYRFITFRTLIETLRLGAPPPMRPDPPDERIRVVEGAQWGNIALYATDDPFIGTGINAEPEREWSIAIRLDPADPARRVLHTRPAQGEWVPIDPVELHQAIRRKLHSLNDPGLPVNARINSLSVADRLVGAGMLRWDSPLVDASRLIPYSRASQEAVEAIIRHPQARLRYYQHVVVNDEGPPVTIGDRLILEGADQGISISAFVYAAVEGRHFYLQFILTALPPIKAEYRVIDLLPALSSGTMLKMALGRASRRFLPATAGSLQGIAWAARLRAAERRIQREALRADKIAVGDLGAKVSVRELGMADHFGSYIRRLDVQKYNRIIERAVLETVQDFLAGKGVDISAFTDSAFNVINGNVIGSVSGGTNQFGGTGSTFHQQQAGPAHQPRGAGS